MLNLGDEQTITPLRSDTWEDLIRMNSEENLSPNHLNLWKVGMDPPHFTSLPLNRQTRKGWLSQYRTIYDKGTGKFCLHKTEWGEIINTETMQPRIRMWKTIR